MNDKSPLILALDSTDIARCGSLIEETRESIGIYKFGLEFYLKNGASGILEIQSKYPDVRIFLDLKLHDIPNTVAAAAKSVANLKPEILTVHASGGSAMISAAVNSLPDTKIAAVTILTSLTEEDLAPFGRPAISKTVEELAEAASLAGARAIVASPNEAGALRARLGSEIKLIIPGIRPAGGSSDDQVRVATPESAIESGADYLVIGRPITGAAEPGKAAAEIYASIK